MKSELKKFILTCPLALLTLVVPSFLSVNQILSAVLLICISILMLSLEWNRKYLILFLAVSISGPIAEAVAIYFGAWAYTKPLFIGIPIWLPFVWGNAGLYIARLKSLIYSFSK
jgi:hypothetical protein